MNKPTKFPRPLLIVTTQISMVLLLTGCGPPPVNLMEVSSQVHSRSYERIFEKWTRHGEVYNFDTLENSLKVSATFLSYEMRHAYVARYTSDYGISEDERREMIDKQVKAYHSYNEFIVAATATKSKWAKFHRKDTPWRITLLTSSGIEAFPEKIERIAKPTSMLRAYFSFITIYREAYRIYFPIFDHESGAKILNPEINSFSLIFAGALGRVELKWKVKRRR